MEIVPESASIRPERRFNKVDFPEPLFQIIAIKSPDSTEKFKSSYTTVELFSCVNDLVIFLISIIIFYFEIILFSSKNSYKLSEIIAYHSAFG
jgi:hypothetical protein